jgi:nicotinamidase-related amidase
MSQTNIDTHTALLVMDVQNTIVERFSRETGFLDHMQTAIAAARSAAIPVMYVVVRFRPGYPEVSSRNKSFSVIKQNPSVMQEATTATDIHPAVAPQPGDAVVIKRRVSAFTGSDLEVILRAQGITQLILSGIATSGVVLSTLREAADRDYQLTVLSDCCLDGDEEVHRVLLSKVFPRQADVITTQEWQQRMKE